MLIFWLLKNHNVSWLTLSTLDKLDFLDSFNFIPIDRFRFDQKVSSLHGAHEFCKDIKICWTIFFAVPFLSASIALLTVKIVFVVVIVVAEKGSRICQFV